MRATELQPTFAVTQFSFRRIFLLGGIFFAAVFLCPVLVRAATIFESGTLGRRGFLQVILSLGIPQAPVSISLFTLV